MNLEDRVSELEARIDALSTSESSSPPNGLVVLPSGEIAYEFEGVLISLGLKLKEAGGEPTNPPNRIDWLSGSAINESIFGLVQGSSHSLRMVSLPEALASQLAMINVLGSTIVSPKVQVITGEQSAILLTGENKSSFMRLLGVEQARVNYGVAELPSAAFPTSAVTVNHLLGNAPNFAIAIAGVNVTRRDVNISTWVEAGNTTQFKIEGRTITGANFTEAVKVWWMVIG